MSSCYCKFKMGNGWENSAMMALVDGLNTILRKQRDHVTHSNVPVMCDFN